MRVLITGAAGFLGAAVTRACKARGDGVHVYLRPTTEIWRLEPALLPRIEVHRGDLLDFDRLAGVVRAIEPEIVIHAAAASGHPGTGQERVDAWSDTVLGTISLLEALRTVGTQRLVHIGSSLEYEAGSRRHREADRLLPETPRGATKAAAFLSVRQWAEETGTPTTCLRPFSVFGPQQPRARLPPTLLRALRDGQPLRTTLDTCRHDYVYVDDVVQGILTASRSPRAIGESFNLGSGVETSNEELIAVAEGVTGKRLRRDSEPFPSRPADRPHWVADISKAERVFGWRPAVGLEEGIERMWRELR